MARRKEEAQKSWCIRVRGWVLNKGTVKGRIIPRRQEELGGD